MPANALTPAARGVLSAGWAATACARCTASLLRLFRSYHSISIHRQWPRRELPPVASSRLARPIFATPILRYASQHRWHATAAPGETRTQKRKKTHVHVMQRGRHIRRERWKVIPQKWTGTAPIQLRRQTKKRFRSPSEFLVDVLSKTHSAWDLARVALEKRNLSYVDPASPHDPKHPGFVHPREEFRPSLQYYLARYLEVVLSSSEPNWDAPMPPRVESWLRRKHYAREDFAIWGSILAEKDASRAATILFDRQNAQYSTEKPIPVFVPLLLLRRKDINASALRRLILYVERHIVLNQTPVQGTPSEKAIVTDEKSLFLIFLRLLRKARATYPEAIPSIARFLTSRYNPAAIESISKDTSDKTFGEKSRKRLVYLTSIYNRALRLLSMPTNIRPYASATFQSRAQFDVLRRMSEYQPPITITQEGYRAVSRVQLAQRKTEPERRWAELKSNSWPPWKEDRTAMDTEIGPEHGISRAGKSIIRMQEAGYPLFGWDKLLKLFAGWDEDGSPVIQSRAIVANVQDALVSAVNERNFECSFSCQRAVDHDIWAARIRTTRTVEESWAVFLTYDALGVPQSQRVYLALFERIIGAKALIARLRRRSGENGSSRVGSRSEDLPGDRREALPVPESPHERLDPRLEPPTVDELLDRMIAKGLHPSGALLALLVRTCGKVRKGLLFLQSSRNPAVPRLLNDKITSQELHAVPEKVFNAYINLLCNFFWIEDRFHIRDTFPFEGDRRPLIHRAIELMDRRRSTYRPGWNKILDSLRKFDDLRDGNTTTELMRQTLKVVERAGVELDGEGFQSVCISFRSRAAIRYKQMADIQEDLRHEAWDEHLMHSNRDSRFLRARFNRLVGLDDSSFLRAADGKSVDGAVASLDMPRLLTTTTPSVLHDYVRALGTMLDYEGLLSVATFMHDHAAQLADQCEADLNARARLRRALVALRVFLERSWEKQPQPQPQTDTRFTERVGQWQDDQELPVKTACIWRAQPAPEELVLLVKEKVEAVSIELGSWPTDEEVGYYVKYGKAHEAL